MLDSQEGSRFEVFENDKKAQTTYSKSGAIGGYGREFIFPYVKQKDGSVYDVSKLRGIEADDFQKFYFTEPLKNGKAGLTHKDGSSLLVTFDVSQTPYLALIHAEGGDFGVHCSYIEPCSAPFDSLDGARLRGKQSVLKGNSEIEWFLNFILN